MALGQNLSGWVAANRQTIMNSDAALDLGDMASMFAPRPKYCLSISVDYGGQLVGVLSLYSANLFTGEDERICRSMISAIVDSSDIESPRQPALVMQVAR